MKAYLVLQNGKVFEGERIGSQKSVITSLAFTSSIAAFLNVLTDRRYSGMGVVQTDPLIGMYDDGFTEEQKAACVPDAYIIRELLLYDHTWTRTYKHLEEYLTDCDVPGVYNIDTRTIIRILREEGTMNAALVSDPSEFTLEEIAAYSPKIPEVPAREISESKAKEERAKVAYIDNGWSQNERGNLLHRGVSVTAYPHTVKAEDILSGGYDGVVIGSGAGDPRDFAEELEEVKKLVGKIPMMGVGLGHQLIAMAQGAQIKKLKFGHRGDNQPVLDVTVPRTYITTQNCSYTVDPATLPEGAFVRYKNTNDDACEGIEYRNIPAITTQFAPSRSSGPHDTTFIYEDFIKMLNK